MGEFPTVILAGGEGRRMGGGKPMRLLKGRTLIEHAVSLARNWSEEVAVAVRDASQVGDVGAPLILDRKNIPGPLGGLVAAMEWACENGYDRVLTIPCDAPCLPADLANRLDGALAPGCGAAVAMSESRAHPTCALWRTDVLADAVRMAAVGQRSLHGLANAVDCVFVDWPDVVDAFLNVNTPAELAAAEEACGIWSLGSVRR